MARLWLLEVVLVVVRQRPEAGLLLLHCTSPLLQELWPFLELKQPHVMPQLIPAILLQAKRCLYKLTVTHTGMIECESYVEIVTLKMHSLNN